jgi:hypothetical protein
MYRYETSQLLQPLQPQAARSGEESLKWGPSFMRSFFSSRQSSIESSTFSSDDFCRSRMTASLLTSAAPLFTQGSNALQSFFKLFPRELVEALCLAIEFYPMDDAINFGPTG